MTLPAWVYVGIAVVLLRVFAGHCYRDMPDEPISAVLLGAVGALMWPLVAAVWALWVLCERQPEAMRRVFFHEPSRARRQRQLKRRRDEIARLERELEL